MKYRKLGKTGLNVSVIGLGTYQFGGSWSKDFTQDEVDNIFAAARDNGINFIDTAGCYGVNNLSEQLIGNAIKSGPRDRWLIATKFGHFRKSPLENEQAWKPEQIQIQLENSLKALKTDYIDLYQFHSGSNEDFDNDSIWEMLEKQKKAGKIRHLGVSLTRKSKDWRNYQTKNAPRKGLETIQVLYNRLDREAEEYIFPESIKSNIGVIVRVALASGLLSGKYIPGYEFTKNDARSKKYDSVKLFEMLKEVHRIKEEEVPEGLSLASWAIAYALKPDAVSVVIPGCKTTAHVEMNARVADFDVVNEKHPLSI